MRPDDQTVIPPSFQVLYQDARGRLTLPWDEFVGRYECCEDMAQLLTEPSSARLHAQGLAEDIVLARTHAGLVADGSGFSPDEAQWVVRRLAELLGW